MSEGEFSKEAETGLSEVLQGLKVGLDMSSRGVVAAEQNAVAQARIATALERIARCYERQLRIPPTDPEVYSGPSRGVGGRGGVIPGGGALGGL